MFAESIIYGMQLLKTEPCCAPTFQFYIRSVARCRKTVHGQTGDADRQSGPSLGSSNCLCVNVYYVRREALWACASTCVQGHAHRQRQGGPGILRQEARRLGFEFSTPERKPSFSLTFYNATLKQFCLALFIMNRRKEIQHLRKLIVTQRLN